MFSETIQLAAGECAILESTGKVTLRLLNGAIEIAGRSLPSNEICSFRSARQGIHFYSLEGGAVAVTSSVTSVHISRSSTPIASLGPMMRSFLSATASNRGSLSFPGSRVLVLGKRGSGKTLAARTFVNFLFRDSITQRRGSNSIENVTLVCGDPQTVTCDTTVAPGCISAVRVTRPGISINTPFLENAHVTFFKAASSVVPIKISDDETQNANLMNRENSSQSLHWLSQAIESSNAVLGSNNSISVVDAPNFFSATSADENNNSSAILENFYSNLIEIVDPSLILFVGGSLGMNNNMMYGYQQQSQQNNNDSDLTQEAKVVKNIIDKMNQQQPSSPMEFVALESFISTTNNNTHNNNNKTSSSSSLSLLSESVADRVEDYFCGPLSLPMKCAKIVVPLDKIQFLTISKNASSHHHQNQQQHGGNFNNNNTNSLTPHRVDVSKYYRSLVGRVCAVSLAAVEAETAYANVAGLVVVESIDVNENELVLFAPAGGSGPEETCLVRPFLLVGDSRLTYNHLGDTSSTRGMDTIEANSI